ncbi:MAG: TrmB family transcriptional regulator [Nitrososphaerales archaeon]
MDQIQKKEQNYGELIERLSEFGLSYDEASTFTLLTRIKKAGVDWITGRELAKVAKRDRVRVYQILQKLVVLGLIHADFGRPTGYSVVSPDVAIEKLVSVQEAKLKQLSGYQSKLKEALEKADPIEITSRSAGSEEQNRPAMSMFHGVSGIRHVIWSSANGNALQIIANNESADFILSTIKRSTDVPASCKLLLSGDSENPPDKLELSGMKRMDFEAAYIKGHLPTFVLTDNQGLILFYSTEKYKPKPLSSSVSRLVMLHALVVSDKIYVEEMHELFNTLWQISAPIKPKNGSDKEED